jgi:hypothetical protein
MQHTVAKLDFVKSEGYMQALKSEVNIMLDMVRCLGKTSIVRCPPEI